MRIIAIGVSLFILISTGCKNSTDIVIGEKEITKIDLKEKESTIYFSESENETKYNMVIISAPKDDEFQDISINVDFEPGNKEPSSESIMSYDENYNDSSEDMAETLEESFTLRETDDLPPKRKFNIPEDSSDELFPTEKIGENENFVLYKDERVSNNFDKDEYFKALENIEYRLKHFAGDVSDEDQNGGRIIFVFTFLFSSSL